MPQWIVCIIKLDGSAEFNLYYTKRQADKRYNEEIMRPSYDTVGVYIYKQEGGINIVSNS